MAGRKIETGPTGQAVARNIKRLREAAGLRRYTELAERLATTRPIAPLALRRIEENDRRVDVDDLVALADALDVSPATLLMPEHNHQDVVVETSAVAATAENVWHWLIARSPLRLRVSLDAWGGGSIRTEDREQAEAFRARAEPRWASQRRLNPSRARRALEELDYAVLRAETFNPEDLVHWTNNNPTLDEAQYRGLLATEIRRSMRDLLDLADDVEKGRFSQQILDEYGDR